MKRRIFLLLILAAAVAAGLYFYPRLGNEPQQEDVLALSGNIEAHESVLSFKVQGRIMELLVEEGQWVEEGAVIARLDAADFRQQVALEEASLRVREAELALALAGTRQQEIEAAQQTLIDAEADLKQKGLDFERAQTLYGKDVISEEARDRAETNLKRAQATYERAKQRYDEALEGTRKEQIAVARANVQQACERLRLARVNLGYTVLEAPRAGVAVVRQAELGEVVAPGTPVVTLADLDNVWLRGYISETDLGRVRWGQPATLGTDTYPGKTYPGRVSFISSKAEFTPKSIQTEKERVTLVYRIKIDVGNPNHELKPGMPADAVIDLKAR
jgi:HlyD family secretion protein